MEINKPHHVYLSLGSNLGNRSQNLADAIDLLNKTTGNILEVSQVFETPPLEMESELNFYNLVAHLETQLDPIPLLHQTQEIEKSLGRIHKSHQGYSSRPIDIDIIYYDHIVYNSEELQIPHRKYGKRKFILEPLKNLSNSDEIRDPETLQTIDQLLESCPDTSKLKLLGNLSR